MTEQVFDPLTAGPHDGRGEFDYSLLLDGLRCHTSEWLEARRVELRAEQRRLHVEELAVLAVLDERGRVDDSLAGTDGVSVQSVREQVETARALESLPEMAAAAYAGRLSDQQLTPAARLADPSSDREWTERAENTAPADLRREARKLEVPTAQEMAARREHRRLRWWRKKDDDRVVAVYGEFVDLDGVVVEKVLDQMVNRMRPAKGRSWDTREHRGADAFVDLCRNYATAHAAEAPEPLFVAHLRPGEPVTIAGIPVPDSLVEAWRPNAKIEGVLEDAHGGLVSIGTVRPVLPRRIRRAVLRRDGHCRTPGCERRTGLQVHHLWPVSWGGTDDIANLATVCVGHHGQLAPHGEYLLLGNPNRPDGLRLVHRDRLGELAQRSEEGGCGIRAGPDTS